MKINSTTPTRLKLLGGILIGASFLSQGCGAPKEVKDAIAMLKLNNEAAREKAIKTLSYHQYAKQAKKKLLQELKDEKSQIPKHEIANALIQVSGAKSDEEVIFALTSDENALKGLIKAISKNPDLVTSFMAYRLGALGSRAKEAEVPLAKALKMDDFETRVEAVSALGKIGVLNSKETVFNLFDLLKDEDDYFRLNAYDALAKVPEDLKTSYFIELLRIHNTKKDVFHFFIKDIGPKIIPNLLNELNTETDPVNKANFLLLSANLSTKCEDKALVSKVLDALVQGLNDKNKWVRNSSCNGLELLGGSKAQIASKQLEEISKADKSEDVRTAALEILNTINKSKEEKERKNKFLNKLFLEYLQ